MLLAIALNNATATHYQIDLKETRSSFEVWMLGFIPVRGQFKHTTGTLIYDAASQAGNIEVLIDTTSIEANSGRAARIFSTSINIRAWTSNHRALFLKAAGCMLSKVS